MFNTLLFLNRIGPAELILIVILVLLLFGGKKIPELMRGLGRGVKEFKDAAKQDYSKEESTSKPSQSSQSAQPSQPAAENKE